MFFVSKRKYIIKTEQTDEEITNFITTIYR